MNVIAAYGGIAHRQYDPTEYGNYIDIDHGNGYITRYAHLLRFLVPSDTSVVKGQVIGVSGGAPGDPGSGDARGAHLHFEIDLNGSYQCLINAGVTYGTHVTQGQPMNANDNMPPSSSTSGMLIANVSPAGTLYIKQGLWGTWQVHTADKQSRAVAISPDGQLIANVAPNNTLYIKQGLWGTGVAHTAANQSMATAVQGG